MPLSFKCTQGRRFSSLNHLLNFACTPRYPAFLNEQLYHLVSHLHIIWVVSRNIVGSAGLTLSEASYELEMLVLVNLGNIVISICM